MSMRKLRWGDTRRTAHAVNLVAQLDGLLGIETTWIQRATHPGAFGAYTQSRLFPAGLRHCRYRIAMLVR